MKLHLLPRLLMSGLLAMGLFVVTASATPVGNLSIANVANGGVTVGATFIDWYPPTGDNAFGIFSNGGDTNIQYSGGTVTGTTNPYGRIRDLNATQFALLPAPPNAGITDFLRFYAQSSTSPIPNVGDALLANLSFRLDNFAPGPALSGCAGVTAVNVECRPLVNLGGGQTLLSPFVLVNRGTYVDVSLGMIMTAFDATGSQLWTGGFTTQVPNTTPDAIQTTINNGGAITRTYSASFNAQAVPEPGTVLLVGSTLVLAGLIRRRRRA